MLPALQRLELLGELSLPPAAAVPDALVLIEEGVPALGSVLLWSSHTGEVAGGYSSLVGMEDGLAHYAERFGNTAREQAISGSTFRDDIRTQIRARRFSDVLQIPEAEFRQTDIYRVMMQPYGIENIARIPVVHDGQPLGGLALFRGADAAEFSDHELRWMERAAPLLGRVLSGRADAGIATIQTGACGAALLNRDGALRDSTSCFRRHLAMLNQNAPGEETTRFAVELPPSITRRLARRHSETQTFSVHNTWGDFRLHLQPFSTGRALSLVSQRLIPVNLHLFRRLHRYDLSYRQLQTACGLAEGVSFNDLAERWGVSRHSVITHAGNLYDKLGLSGRDDLLTQCIWNCPDSLSEP